MRALSILAATSMAAALLVFDVVDLPVAQAVPVPSQTDTLALAGVDVAALREEGQESRPDEGPAEGPAPDARPELMTAEVTTDDFAVLGITWDPDSVDADAAVVSVRVREDAGWSEWEVLDMNDEAPDPGTAEAEQAADVVATGPLAVDDADAVQVRIDTSTGEVPAGVEAVVIDPGTSRADDPTARGGTALSTAGAAAGAPGIISRAQWGADEARSSCSGSAMSTIKAAVVHHTAGTNSYGPGDSAGLIRGIYAYHTGTLGWCDVGYNFLVDRFGQVFEGRGGGMDRAIRGAHAGGFNENTFGISAMGNFNDIETPGVLTDAIARVIAWKLTPHYRDPQGSTQLTSAGGGTARYGAGEVVTLPVVLGHRDVGSTACPGATLYSRLGEIRAKALAYMGAGLVAPTVSGTTLAGGATLSVGAGVLGSQGWHLTVTETCSGRRVDESTGTAGRSQPVAARWHTSGATAGAYDIRLTSWSTATGAVALEKTWSVLLDAGAAPPVAADPPDAAVGRFVAVPPARLLDTRVTGGALGSAGRRDLTVAGQLGIPTTGVSAVALNVTSTCTAGSGSSHLSVWPTGDPQPPTSSLNTAGTETTAGYVVSALGTGGAVSIYNNAGSTQLIVDVVGYFVSDGGGSTYHRLAPRRVFDSRDGGGAPLGNGTTRQVSLTSQPGVVPGTAMTAAVLNVTVAGASGQGFVSVYPSLQPRPATSTVNHVPGADVANRTAVGLGNNAFDVYLAGASAHVVVDLVGYYTAPSVPAGALYQPMTPVRVLDTRTGTGGISGAFGPGSELPVTVAGVAGVPADATAVVMTLTGDQASAVTFATAWPAGTPRPNTSDLNLRPGRTRANTVVATVGSSGAIGLYNDRGTTHLIVDIVGYYR